MTHADAIYLIALALGSVVFASLACIVLEKWEAAHDPVADVAARLQARDVAAWEEEVRRG